MVIAYSVFLILGQALLTLFHISVVIIRYISEKSDRFQVVIVYLPVIGIFDVPPLSELLGRALKRKQYCRFLRYVRIRLIFTTLIIQMYNFI